MRQRFDALLNRLVAELVGAFSRRFARGTPGFARLCFRARPGGATGQQGSAQYRDDNRSMKIVIHWLQKRRRLKSAVPPERDWPHANC